MIYIASRNEHKLREFREILPGVAWAALPGGIVLPEETGVTYEQNAEIKAKAAFDALGAPVVADDSGLEVMALDGRPGVFSARYGGFERLLREMEGVTDRRARFVCCIVSYAPEGGRQACFGVCEGVIAEAPAGGHGFGYDPVFFLPAYGKTMAQLGSEEKNALSHRGMALREWKRVW